MYLKQCNFLQISLEQLEEIKKDPSKTDSIIVDANERKEGIDVEKTWHWIHFLITGSVEHGPPDDLPLSQVIFDGKEIGPDVGYGPARYLMPEAVKKIAESLPEFSREDVKKKFEQEAKEKIEQEKFYPLGWQGDDDIDYLLSYYRSLVKYFKDAAQKGNGMLIYLN